MDDDRLRANSICSQGELSRHLLLVGSLREPKVGCGTRGVVRRAGTMRLYLIRHAESENNAKPVFNRVEDPPLTAVGRLQAHYLAQWMNTLKVDMLLTSPVLRALQTARQIHDQTGHHVHVWDNLFEEGGIYRGHGPEATEGGPGLTRQKVWQCATSDPLQCTIDPSVSDSGWWSRPRETTEQATQRAGAVARRLAGVADGEQVIAAVTHADFKRRLLGALLGQELNPDLFGSLCNTGITRLSLEDGKWRLDCWNAASHLPAKLITGNKI